MVTIHKIYHIKAKPEKIFRYIENIWNIQYNLNLIGIKLNLEILSENSNGVGAAYRWYGNVSDVAINFILFVVKRVNNKALIFQTYSGIELNMILYLEPLDDSTKIDFTLNYLKPSSWSFQSSPNSLFSKSFQNKIIDLIFEKVKQSTEQQNKIVI
ncbi:MAG: hypothetical protein ACFFDF_25320 [Candidatus Odinarchaeota archaeon]